MRQLPVEFTSYTRALMGDNNYRLFMQGMAEEAPASIRLNPYKWPKQRWNVPMADGRVAWCEDGFYLKERPNFTFDPLLHAGCYYVQEASSMFIACVLRQYVHRAVRMLDLCAAPGGKSTCAMGNLPAGSVLVSNEPIPLRAQILSENIQKYGHPDMMVTNNYPADFKRLKTQFDVVLADVPCSGEGMFRKDEGAIDEWSAQNVEACWRLQRSIISEIWDSLRPGGLLIYSTCTFNAHEDEENVRWIAEEYGAELLPVSTKTEWNITGSLLDDMPVYRFIPGKTRGEGLFLAAMRKPGTSEGQANGKARVKKNAKKKPAKKAECASTKLWLKEPEAFALHEEDYLQRAIPTAWNDLYGSAKDKLKVLHAGIELCRDKGKDHIPTQALALSTALKANAFAHYETNWQEAIAFLRKEPVALPSEMPRGYVLITYRGIPIGFEKNIGTRANNLYPQEWRIRSSHVPDKEENVIE